MSFLQRATTLYKQYRKTNSQEALVNVYIAFRDNRGLFAIRLKWFSSGKMCPCLFKKIRYISKIKLRYTQIKEGPGGIWPGKLFQFPLLEPIQNPLKPQHFFHIKWIANVYLRYQFECRTLYKQWSTHTQKYQK